MISLVVDISSNGMVAVVAGLSANPLVKIVGNSTNLIMEEFSLANLLQAEEGFLVNEQDKKLPVEDLWRSALVALLTLQETNEVINPDTITFTYPVNITEYQLNIVSNLAQEFTDQINLFPKSIMLAHANAGSSIEVVQVLDTTNNYLGLQKLVKQDTIWTIVEEKYEDFPINADLTTSMENLFKDTDFLSAEVNIWNLEIVLDDSFEVVSDKERDFFENCVISRLIPDLVSLIPFAARGENFSWTDEQELEFNTLLFGKSSSLNSDSPVKVETVVEDGQKEKENPFVVSDNTFLEEISNTSNTPSEHLFAMDTDPTTIVNQITSEEASTEIPDKLIDDKSKIKLLVKMGSLVVLLLLIVGSVLLVQINAREKLSKQAKIEKSIGIVKFQIPKQFQQVTELKTYDEQIAKLEYVSPKSKEQKITINFDEVPKNTQMNKLYASIYNEKIHVQGQISDLVEKILIGKVEVIQFKQELEGFTTVWYFTLVEDKRVGVGCKYSNTDSSSDRDSFLETCNQVVASIKSTY